MCMEVYIKKSILSIYKVVGLFHKKDNFINLYLKISSKN